jgi:nitrogen fixation protein FixH
MKKGWHWPVLITAALLFTVGANVVMFFASGADPNGTVVEPDYYRKAVDWDRTMARRAASDSLGWRAGAAFGASDESARALTVTLSDSTGVAVADAQVLVTLIHNMEAAQQVQATLQPAAGGGYAGTVAAPRSGRWEVRVDARRGDARFLATLHAEAP